MSSVSGLFNFSDQLQMSSLTQRLIRNNVISGNVANAETPGYRALGYSFEEQLQDISKMNEPMGMKVTDSRHLRNSFTKADGTMTADVFVRPTETVPQDGNTVDIDQEMMELSKNQISYQTTVEFLNRKLGMLRYAINGGR